ncbi:MULTISPECIES: host cell division inhibitor Icd-like protein [Klebsiella]|uniref:host cell division inhibitor Icd-like protein n=1 Tax=Klebsiella TaxID=570 RepID=UPI00098372E3|nr:MULTISPECIES: host cell division inhibitor Icd-like protein [Klebsiella]HDK6067671.1 host cell division inhibitor Icd-like protein [Klebsiella variicola]HDK6597945.1 host cell division inhibitor Icd-like protein [Klebsiella variicola]
MILRKSAVQKEAINLAGLLANVNPQNLIKPDIHRRAVATNDDILEAFSGLRIGLRILINPKFFSSFATSTRTREGEFCESIKKGLPTIANPVYGYSAPAKSGAGIETPNTLRATQTPKASFFVSSHYAHLISGLARTVSMVALVGLRSRRPVSFVSGSLNPANVTANHDIETSGVDSLNTKEAAAMLATTPTQNPQFIWLIAAVRRDMPTITAKIHHIAAETEQEARRSLARDHVCFFAGRIRTGGAHD